MGRMFNQKLFQLQEIKTGFKEKTKVEIKKEKTINFNLGGRYVQRNIRGLYQSTG